MTESTIPCPRCAEVERYANNPHALAFKSYEYTPNDAYDARAVEVCVPCAYRLSHTSGRPPVWNDATDAGLVAVLSSHETLYPDHIDHVPTHTDFAVMVTFEFTVKATGAVESCHALVDGNHRVHRMMRDRGFAVYWLLTAEETRECTVESFAELTAHALCAHGVMLAPRESEVRPA